MVKANISRYNSKEVARFISIAWHPNAKNLVEDEVKQLLQSDLVERVQIYKAPAYLIATAQEPVLETMRARTLLNKVVSFDRATPTDLNVIINQTLKLAVQREEDLAEIGSHFYSRMMRKFPNQNHEVKQKRTVRKDDPSMQVFAQYLR